MRDSGKAVASAALVGRRDALGLVLKAAEGVRAGWGAAIVVEGESGIGKTTLLEAFVREGPSSMRVVWGRARADGDAPALWVWSQLLDELLTGLAVPPEQVIRDDGWAARVVAPRASGVSALVDADAVSASRVELFDAICRVIERCAAVEPIALVIDDIQWADAASWLLLAHLSSRLVEHRILVVAASRPDQPIDENAREARGDVLRAATVLTLPDLDEPAIGELLEGAGISAEPGLVDVVRARTGGNPFFVTRLISMLGADPADAVTTHRVVATEVPSAVAEVIRRRVARLSTPAAALVSIASVIGGEGELDALAAVAGVDVGTVIETLSETDGLLVEVAPAGYAFSHALVRDSIYEALSATERRRLHLRALDAIAARSAATNAQARHAVRALPLGDRGRAVALCAAAGREMVARFAFEDAAIRFESALEAGGGELSGLARGTLLVELGEAFRLAGFSGRARQSFKEAVGDIEGDADLLARAALGFADPGADLAIAYQSSDSETTELLERAIASTPFGAIGARLRARLAAELYFSSQPERALPLAADAIDAGTRSGNHGAIVAALATYHDAFVVGQVPASAALTEVEPIVRHARASRDSIAMLTAHRARLFDLLAVGDFAGVDAEAKAFMLRAIGVRTKAILWWPALWRAMRALLDGRHADAEQAAGAALEIGQDSFGGLALFNHGFVMFFLRREQGRLAEMEAATRHVATEQADIPAVRAALTLLLAEIGKLDEARALLVQLGLDQFAALHDRNWPASWFQLARASYLCRDRSTAETLLADGRRFAGECVTVSLATACLGSADLALAWCSDTVGDIDAADVAYRRAAATNARIGARSWLAQALLDHAALIAARPEPMRGQVEELATRALVIAEDVGLPPIATRARHLLSGRVDPAKSEFVREATVWQLHFGGAAATVAQTKGLADIAWLLARPHEPVSAVELVARQAANGAPTATTRGDPIFDDHARRALRDRFVELDTEINEADQANDLERASRLRTERDQLLDTAASALGLGGRNRRLGDDTERARKAVTARIRNAITHIAKVHPTLGTHLDRSIDTGTWCAYRPEHPVTWTT